MIIDARILEQPYRAKTLKRQGGESGMGIELGTGKGQGDRRGEVKDASTALFLFPFVFLLPGLNASETDL